MFSSSSPIVQLVDKATSELLTGPDWGLTMEICDNLNRSPAVVKEAVKAMKKRLSSKFPRTQFLTVTLLEAVVKNCGQHVHQQVAERDVPSEMAKLVKKKNQLSPEVREKVLEVVDVWQEAFGGPGGKPRQYFAAFEELRKAGVSFPPRDPTTTVPVFTPPQTTPIMPPSSSTPNGAFLAPLPGPALNPNSHSPASGATGTAAVRRAVTTSGGNGGGDGAAVQQGVPAHAALGGVHLGVPAGVGDEVDAGSHELSQVRAALDVLQDALAAPVGSADPSLFSELASQAREQQKQLSAALNAATDEHFLVQGLQLNDELQAALTQCEARSAGGSGAGSGAGLGASSTAGSAAGLGAGSVGAGLVEGGSGVGATELGARDERGKGKGKATAVEEEEEESAVGSSGHIPDSTSSYGFTPSEVDADFARLATRFEDGGTSSSHVISPAQPPVASALKPTSNASSAAAVAAAARPGAAAPAAPTAAPAGVQQRQQQASMDLISFDSFDAFPTTVPALPSSAATAALPGATSASINPASAAAAAPSTAGTGIAANTTATGPSAWPTSSVFDDPPFKAQPFPASQASWGNSSSGVAGAGATGQAATGSAGGSLLDAPVSSYVAPWARAGDTTLQQLQAQAQQQGQQSQQQQTLGLMLQNQQQNHQMLPQQQQQQQQQGLAWQQQQQHHQQQQQQQQQQYLWQQQQQQQQLRQQQLQQQQLLQQGTAWPSTVASSLSPGQPTSATAASQASGLSMMQQAMLFGGSPANSPRQSAVQSTTAFSPGGYNSAWVGNSPGQAGMGQVAAVPPMWLQHPQQSQNQHVQAAAMSSLPRY